MFVIYGHLSGSIQILEVTIFFNRQNINNEYFIIQSWFRGVVFIFCKVMHINRKLFSQIGAFMYQNYAYSSLFEDSSQDISEEASNGRDQLRQEELQDETLICGLGRSQQ